MSGHRSVAFLSPPKDAQGRPCETPTHADDPASPADSTRSLYHFRRDARAEAAQRRNTALISALKGTAKYTAIYAVLGAICRFVLARWGSAEIIAASAEKRARLVLYVLSTINCFVTVIPFLKHGRTLLARFGSLVPAPYTSVTRLGETRLESDSQSQSQSQREAATDSHGDLHMTATESRALFRDSKFIEEAILGYLVHDLIMIAPEASQYPADIFHHVAGIICGFSSLLKIRRVYPFLPVFFTAEFSTLFLNLIWFFREYPTTAAIAFPGKLGEVLKNRVAPLGFAATFGVVRAVLFPYMKLKLWATPTFNNADGAGSGRQQRKSNVLEEMLGKPAAYTLLSLQLLQWYWFVLVAKKVVRQLSA